MHRSARVGGLCLAVGLWAGTQLHRAETRAWATEPEARVQRSAELRPVVEPVGEPPRDYSRYQKLDTFARALAILEQYYVRPLNGERLLDAAIAGLVSELDPHTAYLPPADAKLLHEDTQGRFGGVGLIVTLRSQPTEPTADEPDEPDEPSDPTAEAAPSDDASAPGDPAPTQHARWVLHIDDVVPGGPAEQAGLEVGDLILAIEGKPIAHYTSLHDAVMIMRGEPGTQATFTTQRDGGPAVERRVTRAIVDPPAVEVRWLGEGLGVLRLRDFQATSAREMREGLVVLEDMAKAEAKAAGARTKGALRGVVLDLRDNGGGLLDQAVEIVDMFVASGPIVRTRGRQGVLLDEARAQAAGTERDLPLVVLINKGSASASEIVAGALQDHARALIIGERSYGKGSVQSPFELGGGALLKLTTALYYTPDDRLIQASGIAPDIRVGPIRAELTDSRPDLEPERTRDRHLRPEDFGREPAPTDDLPSPARVAADDDAQLLSAIDHLQAWATID